MTKQAKPRKEPCTARCPEKCRCVKCHLYDGAFGGLECTCTTASDQSGQTEKQGKVEQEIYNPILGRTQKLMNCPKPDPAPAGGEEKEFRALEFHSLALEIRKYFDDAELEVSDTVCGHLAIMMQKHMEAARTSAFNECKEKTIEIVSKAKADTPQTFEYIALEKVKQKIQSLKPDGND